MNVKRFKGMFDREKWEEVIDKVLGYIRLNDEDDVDYVDELDVEALTASQRKWLRILEKYRLVYKVYLRIMFVILGLIIVRMVSGAECTKYFLQGRYLLEAALIWMNEFIAAGVINIGIEWRMSKKLRCAE